MKLLFLLCLTWLVELHAAPDHLVVALARNIPSPIRELVATNVCELLFGTKTGTRITVVTVDPFATLADVTVPEGGIRLRQQRIRNDVVRIFSAIMSSTNSASSFLFPDLCDAISKQLGLTNVSIIVVGPSLYRDKRQPSLDFTEAYPSGGHLMAGNSRSPFSTVESINALNGNSIHWITTDSSAVMNAFHADKVRRFLSLYVASQDGILASYSPDVSSCFANALASRTSPVVTAKANPGETNIVMLSAAPKPVVTPAPEPVIVTKYVTNYVRTNTVDVVSQTVIPKVATGNTGIGLVWFPTPGIWDRVDLDLYVFVAMDGAELSFKRLQSAHAKYFRDIQHSTSDANGNWQGLWEFVEIAGDNLPPEVWINIYAGKGPVTGELRLQVRGEEHRIAFQMPAVNGNGGRDREGRERSQCWLKLDLRSFR